MPGSTTPFAATTNVIRPPKVARISCKEPSILSAATGSPAFTSAPSATIQRSRTPSGMIEVAHSPSGTFRSCIAASSDPSLKVGHRAMKEARDDPGQGPDRPSNELLASALTSGMVELLVWQGENVEPDEVGLDLPDLAHSAGLRALHDLHG